jgi:GYF domain 2
MYKIIGADGKEYGPITAEQLRQWIAEGRVNAQTKIQMEGASEWRPLSDFPEFIAAVPGAPPPVSAGPALATPGADQVTGPAIALIILAAVETAWHCLAVFINLLGLSFRPARQMPNEAWANMFSGTAGAALAGVGLVLAGLMLLGGIKMKRLESYGLAMTAAVLAMLPCSLCCVLGLPLGIWSLVVLTKPEVKSAFH